GKVELKTGIEIGELKFEKKEKPSYSEIPNLITNNLLDFEKIQDKEQLTKNLHNAVNKDEYIKYTTITLFLNEKAYNKRMTRYRKWYQSKKKLLTKVGDLYNLYYKLSKKDRPMTKTEIEEAIEDILINE
ncbi:38282_t:CDS:2, partial [Gigaspora margarita]